MKMDSKMLNTMQLMRKREQRDAEKKRNKNSETFKIKLSNMLLKSYRRSRKIRSKLNLKLP
jgi:hypothetical protein